MSPGALSQFPPQKNLDDEINSIRLHKDLKRSALYTGWVSWYDFSIHLTPLASTEEHSSLARIRVQRILRLSLLAS